MSRTTADSGGDAEETTRKERRERYNDVLATIAHNTTDRQSPGIRPLHVRLHMATHGHWTGDGVDKSIRRAVERDDLVRWRDAEGKVRLTLRTEHDLQRLAVHIAEELEDPKQLGRINRALAEVRDADA